MKRAGFTLVEVMISLVLTSLIALIVHDTLSLVIEGNVRAATHEAERDADRALRVLFENAFRNAHVIRAGGGPTFVLLNDVAPAGLPRDELIFATRASEPPFTPATDWELQARVSHTGLRVSARPQGSSQARTLAIVPDIVALDVQVLGIQEHATWQDTWRDDRSLPRAVRLTFWKRKAPGTSLVVILSEATP